VGGCAPHFSTVSSNPHFTPKAHFISRWAATALAALMRHLSTFPSAKIKNQNLIIPQCSRASSGIPLKSDLSQIKLIGHKKIPKFFSATFIGNHWQIRQKPPKKPCEITQKNARF
jgi:hypothetical protein